MSLIAILILALTFTTFGVWITLRILRTLGNRAHKSAVCYELIGKLIKYRSAHYHLHLSGGEVKSEKITQNEVTSDDESLENALKQFGYQKGEILKALLHIKQSMEQGTIEDKIKESLKYLGGNL